MTSFAINSLTTTARTLLGGESGFIGAQGALYVNGNSAITGTGPGTHVVDVHGVVTSTSHAAISLAGSSALVSVGAGGHVSAKVDTAIQLALAGSVQLDNSGTIQGAGNAIAVTRLSGSGNVTLTNSGKIAATATAISLGANMGSTVIVNSGEIQSLTTAIGMSPLAESFFLSFVNTGLIHVASPSQFTAITLTGGQVDFTNSGTIIGSVSLVALSSSFLSLYRNTGLIDGDLTTGNNADVIDTRLGTITGTISGRGGNDQYLVGASGAVISEQAAGGTDMVRSTVSFALSANIETLLLEGTGDSFGTGNALANQIEGNGGNNRLLGRDGNDTLQGQDGDDWLGGGSGNDTLSGGTGNDTLRGGSGSDTASYAEDAAGVLADLTAGTATGDDAGDDTLVGIAHLTGGSGDDTLAGSSAANLLQGGNGDDVLRGGTGSDTLAGGFGRDVLSGGSHTDTFVFADAADSKPGAGIRDLISDFRPASAELIDLTGIDAITGGGDDAFAFIGAAALSGVAGQLNAVQNPTDGYTLIAGDTDGDGLADFEIQLTGLYTLTTAHFLL